MEKINDLLNKANELQKNANLDAAEEIYINIINSYPEHPDANHNLASLYFTYKNYKKGNRYEIPSSRILYNSFKNFFSAKHV